MRVYVEVAKRAFQRQLAYRTANLAGLTTNSFWGALRSFVFIGLYHGRTVEAGWALPDAIDFVWLTQALIMPIYIWGWWEIGKTIQSGDVVADLTKPFDFYTFWLSQDAGRAVYHTLMRGAPTLLLGALLFGVRLPLDGGRWLWFGLSLALAIWISFGIRFLVNIVAFWLLDYRGVGSLVMLMSTLLSGFIVPINFFPDWARTLVGWLPFAGLIQVPVEVLLGKREGIGVVQGLAFQATWALGLAVVNRLVLMLAVRKVVIQGG